MRRLTQAPNAALATLWADMLTQEGIPAMVLRAHSSSIAGEIPPDQALPEVWVLDESQHVQAQSMLYEMRHRPHRHWVCRVCGEGVDGPFDQCWQCGALRLE